MHSYIYVEYIKYYSTQRYNYIKIIRSFSRNDK